MRTEYLVVAGIVLLVSLLFAYAKIVDVGVFRGDTAIFFQTTQNIAHGHGATSQVFSNTRAWQESRYGVMTAREIATDPLAPPRDDARNLLSFHAYYVLFPLAALTAVFPVSTVLLGAYALSFAGILGLAYLRLRARSVGIIAALLFCVLVAAHPAWWTGLFYGQFFPDRLFVVLGFAFAMALTRTTPSRVLQAVAAAGCLLVGERGALYAGIFGALYLVLYGRSVRDLRFKAVLSGVLLVAGALIMKLGIANSEYDQFLPGSLNAAIRLWQQPQFAADAAMLVAVNLPFLVLAFFEYRAGIIATVALLPNLFGSIGGAEKVGWSTHYHDYYLPLIVWAAAQGLIALQNRVSQTRYAATIYAAPAVFLVALAVIGGNPLPAGRDWLASSFGASAAVQVEAARQLEAAVPKGAVVTTTEGGMPFLYDGRTVRFYPIGMDSAQYAVVGATRVSDTSYRYSGAVCFLGPQETAKVDAALTRRLQRDGFDVGRPVFIPAMGLAVLRRLR